MKKTNILFGIWGILVIAIISLLTVMGFMLKDKMKNYQELEDKLKVSAEKYTSDNYLFPQEGKSIVVTVRELIDKGYLKDLKQDKDVCDGYVDVYTDKVVKYKAYIKCDKYTTKNYDEKK